MKQFAETLDRPVDSETMALVHNHDGKVVMTASILERQLRGYAMTTAEILYFLPDHPSLLQSFTWQELDIAPKFPELRKFLDFWSQQIEGRLHEVNVAHNAIIKPPSCVYAKGEWLLH